MLIRSQPQKLSLRKRVALLLTLVAMLPGFIWGQSVAAAPPAVSEYELQAVYLYNFLRFVSWPQAKGEVSGVKVIAVVGHSPIEAALKQLQAKLARSGKGSSLVVTFHGAYRAGMNLRDCHLLYVADSEKNNFPQIIASLGRASVLTVAEGKSFLSAGGMIALLRQDNSLRWAINRRPFIGTGLQLRAKLLEMAVNIVGDKSSLENEGEVLWFASVI